MLVALSVGSINIHQTVAGNASVEDKNNIQPTEFMTTLMRKSALVSKLRVILPHLRLVMLIKKQVRVHKSTLVSRREVTIYL